jgi:hypothetical protein
MTAFSQLALDFYDDPYIIKNMKQIPDYVRSTSLTKRAAFKDNNSEDFALIMVTQDGGIYPKFPTNTPGDTWLSVKAFEKNAAKMPIELQEIAAHFLKEAVSRWGIEIDVSDTFTKVASQNLKIDSNTVTIHPNMEFYQESVKIATAKNEEKLEKLSSSWFALITTDTAGNTVRRYPLHTPSLIKKASIWFDDHCTELQPALRKEFADNLIKAASQQGVVMASEKAFKYANFDYNPDLDLEIEVRKSLTLDRDQLGMLDELLEKKASLNPNKFAQVLTKLDEQIGLDKYWDSNISDPYSAVFSMPKMADYSYSNGCKEITGNQIRKAVKAENFREKMEGQVSKEIIDEMEGNPVEIFESLPRPTKDLIIDLITEK